MNIVQVAARQQHGRKGLGGTEDNEDPMQPPLQEEQSPGKQTLKLIGNSNRPPMPKPTSKR